MANIRFNENDNFRVGFGGTPEEEYYGLYTVIPTEMEQMLPTAMKKLEQNIIVKPIPAQYIVPTGERIITENGEYDVREYATANIDVQPDLQEKTAEPMESAQTITADSGFYGLERVIIGAVSDTYVGSHVPRVSGMSIVPTEEVQTVMPADSYASGDIYVTAIPEEYIVPTGTKSIITNGIEDVRVYEYANVNVPTGEDGNQMLYGSSSCIVGTATVGSAYAWTDYSGDNIGIAGKAIVGTDATV